MTSRPLHRPGDIEPRSQWPPPDVEPDQDDAVNEVYEGLGWFAALIVVVVIGGSLGATLGASLLIRIVT